MKDNFKNLKQLIEQFSDEKVCRQYLEEQRWNGKPRCPHCRNDEKIYKLNDGKTYKCGNKECYKKFTVTVGTIFENSNIKLPTWFAAIYIITAHKKGISSLQLSRDLSVTQKTAWFLNHRIREMLKEKEPLMLTNMVEVDETYIGGKEKNKHFKKRGYIDGHKIRGRRDADTKKAVVGVIEREGKVVAKYVPNIRKETVFPLIAKHVPEGTRVVTDEWIGYTDLRKLYDHDTIQHRKRVYVIGDVHTNTIENYWSVLKRGLYGIYHTVSRKHLQRYLDEFGYRFNSRKIFDAERFTHALRQTGNARIKYKDLIKKITEEIK